MAECRIEFDGRYRYPYRVIRTFDNGCRVCMSRHKSRAAADKRISEWLDAQHRAAAVKARRETEQKPRSA